MSFRRMRHVKAREVQGCDVAYDFSDPTSLYDATSGGALVAADGTIARANDLSGNGRHATQGTSGKRPARKVAYQGGLDASLYSGGQFLSAGDVADMLDKPANVVGVVRRSSGNNGSLLAKISLIAENGRYGVFWISDGKPVAISHAPGSASGSWEIKDAAVAPTTMTVMASQANRTTGTNAARCHLRKNGAVSASGNTYTDTGASANITNPIIVGAALADSYLLDGHIGQVAKYSSALSDAQYRRIELAMARKWRIAT